MKTIQTFKFSLKPMVSVEIHQGAEILSADIEYDTIMNRPYVALSAIVDSSAEMENRTFYIVGEGQEVQDSVGAYITSFRGHRGVTMEHLFSARDYDREKVIEDREKVIRDMVKSNPSITPDVLRRMANNAWTGWPNELKERLQDLLEEKEGEGEN